MTDFTEPPTDFTSVMKLLDRIEHFEPEKACRECEEYHQVLLDQYSKTPTKAIIAALELTRLFYNQLNNPEEIA